MLLYHSNCEENGQETRLDKIEVCNQYHQGRISRNAVEQSSFRNTSSSGKMLLYNRTVTTN